MKGKTHRNLLEKPFTKHLVFSLLLIFYFGTQVKTLLLFPVVHSDELWLKGIANAVKKNGTLWVTEPFFDLYPRAPHPFRWLYVFLQNFAITAFGDSVTTMRIISLIFSLLCLILFYLILNRKNTMPLTGTILLALNIAFINSSHMGRQETAILFFMLLTIFIIQPYFRLIPDRFSSYGLHYKTQLHQKHDFKIGVILAFVIFLSIGIHPNSFILGFICFLICLYLFLRRGHITLFLTYTLTLALSFVVMVWFFSKGHPGFFKEYLTYGASLGLGSTPQNRFVLYTQFFYKLWVQIGGTYDLFDIRIWLILAPLATVLPIIKWLKTNRLPLEWLGLVGTLVGLFLLGRNNAFSILLIMPWLIMFITASFQNIFEKYDVKQNFILLISLLIVAFSVHNLWYNLTGYEKQHFYHVSYSTMVSAFDESIPDDAIVLGNLNMIDAVDENRFYDIRNLTFLPDSQGALLNYLRTHHINYIVLHDEMAYIKKNAPKWDILYGSLDYYDDLLAIIDTYGEKVIVIDNPTYAMRIASFSGTYPWQSTVYKIVLP